MCVLTSGASVLNFSQRSLGGMRRQYTHAEDDLPRLVNLELALKVASFVNYASSFR